MDLTLVLARMALDLLTCGDPTVRGSDPLAAIPIAKLLAALYDLMNTLRLC